MRRSYVHAVADDHCDAPDRHTLVRELGLLGQDRTKCRNRLVVERRVTSRVVVVLIEARGAAQRAVREKRAGVEAAGAINGKYTTGVAITGTAANGIITVTFGAAANTNILGGTLTLTATDNVGAVEWACAASFANKWLPASCRTAP